MIQILSADAVEICLGLLEPSLPEQPFKKRWQVFMILRGLIVQADLLLSCE